MISTGNCVLPRQPKPWQQASTRLAWALILVSGFGWLLSYQLRAGAPAVAPDQWPAAAGLSLDPARSNLVMFAHPRCPCSEASLEELQVVLTRGQEKIKATLCFFTPEGVPEDWTQTSLVRAAREIPGLNVVVDRDGTIAAKFGALTSGQILMYDSRGQRVFAGGITPARGHAGENRGRALVLALARNEVCGPGPTPVFGCALRESPPIKEASP
jgi:hypothetical protein